MSDKIIGLINQTIEYTCCKLIHSIKTICIKYYYGLGTVKKTNKILALMELLVQQLLSPSFGF